ncbi:DUF2062 domain-containing protein [Vogesella sp. LIG4]|uniref:DUF2062 domain-containing protein n=1 Tax=Vogesella sp. LIG4 TaxID=1192162 RepID=UPI00081FFD35|nr:DUF2062 domain-containing protein [Vogesella sp. LIG4]SCK21207.1 hypothetical protein PSELUDRAFT_2392 [Vogesella sp. LIG4]
MARLKRWVRGKMGIAHGWLQTPALRFVRPYLDQPRLWSVQRRNVARAVAVGMFSGLMPGPTQMLTAGLLALLFRINLPVALICTLYTNPFTYLPLYFLAFRLGERLLGQAVPATMPQMPEGAWHDLALWGPQLLHWLREYGTPLLLGVPVLGLILAALGYGAVMLGWRLVVRHHWQQRKTQRGSHRKNSQ